MFDSYENTVSPGNINIGLPPTSVTADQVADVCQIARCSNLKESHSCSHIIWINLAKKCGHTHTVRELSVPQVVAMSTLT